MIFFPDRQQVEGYARDGYRSIPVATELYADELSTVEALRRLQAVSRHCFILESAQTDAFRGRYSFLGFDPKLTVTAAGGVTTVSVGGTTFTNAGDMEGVRQTLAHIVAEHKAPRIDGMPPFAGGLVGYFGYDFIQYSEPSLKLDARDDEGFKDLDLMLFDKVVCFDHRRQKILLIANANAAEMPESYARACETLRQMRHILLEGRPAPRVAGRLLSPMRALFGKEAFCSMVEKAKRHIFDGDIFQVVLSNRLDADFEGSLLDTYRVLRSTNPSPYMFYFSSDQMEIAGASPETLVELHDGVLKTFPLAGTRPRGLTPARDRELEAELLADPKEKAEHNMLVDLGRNDLGRISKFGTVKVNQYMVVHRFSHVMHIGSEVEGELDPRCTPIDVVSAVLPAGTLSGAPKIRACQIINELEDNKRGIYGGAIGYVGFDGNLDTCIGIRIAYKKNGKVFIRSGAGIVADSVPETEYQECINKAQAVVAALRISQGGLDDDRPGQ